MRAFFDSSAYAKRFIAENGSDEADEICAQSSHLGLTVICVPEVISALNRRIREKRLARSDYATVKMRLALESRDADIINITDEVLATVVRVLETTTSRTMDAIHIASAIEWKCDLFVTADANQCKAAQAMGLKARRI